MITSKKIQKEMMKKKNSKYMGILLILFLVVFAYEIYTGTNRPQNEVSLVRCIDGDTAQFSLGNEEIKVRFLAIDAPEVAKGNTPAEEYGEEAKVYACDALTAAQEIKLEYEDAKEDKYGRTLAWVWVDGVLLQESLVRQGLAEVKYLYDDYKYTNVVQIGERDAKNEGRGIWSEQ